MFGSYQPMVASIKSPSSWMDLMDGAGASWAPAVSRPSRSEHEWTMPATKNGIQGAFEQFLILLLQRPVGEGQRLLQIGSGSTLASIAQPPEGDRRGDSD